MHVACVMRSVCAQSSGNRYLIVTMVRIQTPFDAVPAGCDGLSIKVSGLRSPTPGKAELRRWLCDLSLDSEGHGIC